MRIVYSDPGPPAAPKGSPDGRWHSGPTRHGGFPDPSRRRGPMALSLAPADRSGTRRERLGTANRVHRAAPTPRWGCRVALLLLAVALYFAIGRDLVQLALASGRTQQTQLRRDLRALGKTYDREAALGRLDDAGDGAPRGDAGAAGRGGGY
jgi:hypothetical protein